MNRNRLLYLALIVLTVLAGLASRHFSSSLPRWITLYLGDALWALMVFFGFAFLFKRKSTLWIAAATLLFSFAIEISQLYHAPWIDSIRHTRIGGLILGFGFLWSDLVFYTAGIVLGVVVDKFLHRKRLQNNRC
jgi:glycopeptide antibiotics resistance protein